MHNNNSGLTTIEAVREEFNQSYEGCHILTKIELKAWLYYSESRHRNNNKPLTFGNYTNHMREIDYIEQIELNMLDCNDIGGKEYAIQYLKSRM